METEPISWAITAQGRIDFLGSKSKIFPNKKAIIRDIAHYLEIPYPGLYSLETVDTLTLINILVHLEAKDKLSRRD